MKHQGSCHCGPVKFNFDGPEIESGLLCICSICRRKGAVMMPLAIAANDLSIETSV